MRFFGGGGQKGIGQKAGLRLKSGSTFINEVLA
jgi:hypothetical protein